ncbi:MAG: hypothetical protein ACR2N6_07460 [Miltoncostaeaceae bacterium]
MKRGLEDRTKEIAEAAENLRALESARLDAAAGALWSKVMSGEERAHEVWLRNRSRYGALNGLDLDRESDGPSTTYIVNTAPPPEIVELIDDDGPGELEAASD